MLKVSSLGAFFGSHCPRSPPHPQSTDVEGAWLRATDRHQAKGSVVDVNGGCRCWRISSWALPRLGTAMRLPLVNVHKSDPCDFQVEAFNCQGPTLASPPAPQWLRGHEDTHNSPSRPDPLLEKNLAGRQ